MKGHISKSSLLLTFILSLTSNVISALITESGETGRDTIIRVDAKPESGFNWPYYLFLPAGTPKNTLVFLLVETNNTGVNDTFEVTDQHSRMQIQKYALGRFISRKLKLPFLMPVFPRTLKEGNTYTHALDRDAVIKKKPVERPDLQLIAMFTDARLILKNNGILLRPKVLMNGFSASGTFANRFTMIHPQLVAGVACGGINAMPILPVKSLQKQKMHYPVGLSDFRKLFGSDPDTATFRMVPQFLYMGALDNNDAVLFDDAYDARERKEIYNAVGKEMPERWQKCHQVYAGTTSKCELRTYSHIGHGTDDLVHTDLIRFFKNIITGRPE